MGKGCSILNNLFLIAYLLTFSVLNCKKQEKPCSKNRKNPVALHISLFAYLSVLKR